MYTLLRSYYTASFLVLANSDSVYYHSRWSRWREKEGRGGEGLKKLKDYGRGLKGYALNNRFCGLFLVCQCQIYLQDKTMFQTDPPPPPSFTHPRIEFIFDNSLNCLNCLKWLKNC